MKPNGNGSSPQKDELERVTKGATQAMDDAKAALNRLLEELKRPRLKPVQVSRGDRGDASF